MNSSLRYLERKEIDIEKWDWCIQQAPNGLIYARSFFLDEMSEHWSAIVMDDYQAVMPVVWKKKFGIKYIPDTAFIQRLGIYSTTVADAAAFIDELITRFAYIDACFETDVHIPFAAVNYRSNYVLDLNRSYEQIRPEYTPECLRNIAKAENRGCCFTHDIPVNTIAHLYEDVYGNAGGENRIKMARRLTRVADHALARNMLSPCAVRDRDTGELLFAALVFKDEKRLYYLMGAPSVEGRRRRATYYFIDQLVREFAGRPLIFDFEGSDISGVAAFYRRFSPSVEKYVHIKSNRLPWPVRLFKG